MEPLPAQPWSEWMRTCRRNLGSRTGDFWKENRGRLAISPLLRPGRKDPLDRLWKDQELLFTRGEIQLAALVGADATLFRRAWVGGPVWIVHSPDPHFESAPNDLVDVALALRDFESADPELDELVEGVLSPASRVCWFPVPELLARGRELYLSVVYLDRGAMPDRWLAGNLFPVLCLRDETPAMTLLPSEYWPADLVRSWREKPRTEAHSEPESIVVKGYAWPTFACFAGPMIALDRWFEFTNGEAKAADQDPGRIALAVTIGAVLLFLFDLHDRKRAAEPRYFSAHDGHPITVTFSRRFAFLLPRTWCYIAWGYAAIVTILAWVRR